MTTESTTEVLVGGAVLVVAIGFLAYAGQVTGLSGGSQEYELSASFRSADGVIVGTDVRLAGVKVGRVTELELDRKRIAPSPRSAFWKGSMCRTTALSRSAPKVCWAATSWKSCPAVPRSISNRETKFSSPKGRSALYPC